MFSFFARRTGIKNAFTERKTRVSKNPVAAFFQQSAKEQKKSWKEIVHKANVVQKNLIES